MKLLLAFCLCLASCAPAPQVECGCQLGNGHTARVVVKSIGETIWTVGYYEIDGSWHGEQDFGSRKAAQDKADKLNREGRP